MHNFTIQKNTEKITATNNREIIHQRTRAVLKWALIIGLATLSCQCTRREVLSDIQTVLAPDRGMILIPEGSFMMGSNNTFGERPVHEVYLSAYYISQNLVTNAQYYEFWKAEDGGNSNSHTPPQVGYYNWPDLAVHKSDHPVVGIIWYDADLYTQWMSARTGKKYRLPTEAEWEKAARGTDQRTYPWGNTPPDSGKKYRANYAQQPSSDGFTLTSPVSYYNGINLYTADGKSPYGIYDMAGNVSQWVFDFYASNYYSISPRNNPQGPPGTGSKCIRGGSWSDSSASRLRCSARRSANEYSRQTYIGFRVVMEIE